jgi:GNAT superfamily N-acetyltransferase
MKWLIGGIVTYKALCRIGEKRDADILIQFNIAMARETEGKELSIETVSSGVTNLLKKPSAGFYVVAEKQGQIIGSLMITSEWSDWRNGFFWWIQSVYVRPEFRCQGIYRLLHTYVRDKAKKEPDVCGLRLYVENENSTAKKAYEKTGMIKTSYSMYEEDFNEKLKSK